MITGSIKLEILKDLAHSGELPELTIDKISDWARLPYVLELIKRENEQIEFGYIKTLALTVENESHVKETLNVKYIDLEMSVEEWDVVLTQSAILENEHKISLIKSLYGHPNSVIKAFRLESTIPKLERRGHECDVIIVLGNDKVFNVKMFLESRNSRGTELKTNISYSRGLPEKSFSKHIKKVV